MIFQRIIGFHSFLRENEIFIPSVKLYNLLKSLEYIDVTNLEQVKLLIKTNFAMNNMESVLLLDFFDAYIKNIESVYNISCLKKEKQRILNEENTNIKNELDPDFLKLIKLGEKTDYKNILENNPSLKFIKNLMDKEMQKSKDAIMKSNKDDFTKHNENFNYLKAVLSYLTKKEKKIYGPKESDKIQNKINKILNSMQEDKKELSILKEKSICSRENFVGGKNKVGSNSFGEIGAKEVGSLNYDDFNEIRRYLKQNINNFKTKMKNSINKNQAEQIEINKIIKTACKTGGLPFELFYKKPKEKKYKLVMLLDISGSCSHASKLSVELMYNFTKLFKGGVETYCFVDSLFNISDIMKSDNIENAYNKIFSTVPTRGVYSNYYDPLKSFLKTVKMDKDTFFILIGDARNNNNPSTKGLIKQIVKNTKRSYFLCTENSSLWDREQLYKVC